MISAVPTICPQVLHALKILYTAGYEAYQVGGCVRDFLLGKEPTDWDITTSALPHQVKVAFANFPVIETGIQHGTVTVLLNKIPLEITTFRVDGVYTDGRRPDEVHFTASLTEDLARRDFTVNALAYHPEKGIIDPFGGISDLERKIIRAVGDPHRRFSEDALRLLRAVRFSSVLGFSIEKETAKSIHKDRRLLQKIAKERIAAELKKLLCGGGVHSVLMEYPDLFSVFIPELIPLMGFDQRTPYHLYDIYEHTAFTVAAAPPDPILRLTMLLHDIGKPACFTVDRKGQGHFKGHPAVSRKMAGEILHRLKLDNGTFSRILTLIQHHDERFSPTKKAVKHWLNLLGYQGFCDLITVMIADNHGKNLAYLNDIPKAQTLRSLADEIEESGECYSLKQLAVNGGDLLTAGVPAGQEIGRTLEMLLTAVIWERCENEQESLLKYLILNSNYNIP